MRSLQRYPPGARTFGVVTFSMSQRTLIEDLLDAARVAHPKIEAHFSGPEGVFVKNLENVQGDERDEILFSIGYAKDTNGKLRMHFGPLSNAGGERRLNVAVTRARMQLRVFSTLTHDQIDLSKTNAVGTRHLREFLRFAAERGAPDRTPAGAHFPSAFEREVHAWLVSKGHEVHTAIGQGSYRVDLAVVHPERPGEYLLGIELDGPAYASGHTARDRDRLRGQVLRSLGWRLHRIWSADWWFERETELERLSEVIRTALVEPDPQPEPEPELEPAAIEAESAVDESAEQSLTPYPRPELPSLTLDFHDASAVAPIVEIIRTIVDAQAPVHKDDLMRGVLGCFAVGRLTAQPRRRLDAILEHLNGEKVLFLRGEFVWKAEGDVERFTSVRGPDETGAYRSLSSVPAEELANGAADILSANLSLPYDDLVRETARLFGVSRVGQNVQETIEQGLALLEASGQSVREGDRISWRGRVG